MDMNYQICLIDPEGARANLPRTRTIGDEKHAPSIKQLKKQLKGALEKPADRPDFFASLIAQVQELRIRTGRPHWLIIDEVFHVLPSVVMITVYPRQVSPAAPRSARARSRSRRSFGLVSPVPVQIGRVRV
jgi:hypothetical protein